MNIPKYSLAVGGREFKKPLEIENVQIPETIEPEALLVKIKKSSICGTDIHLWQGNLNWTSTCQSFWAMKWSAKSSRSAKTLTEIRSANCWLWATASFGRMPIVAAAIIAPSKKCRRFALTEDNTCMKRWNNTRI